MKWHDGLADDWEDLPDLDRGKREVPPEPDTPDQDLKATETGGVLVVRREGSSTHYVAGGAVDLGDRL